MIEGKVLAIALETCHPVILKRLGALVYCSFSAEEGFDS